MDLILAQFIREPIQRDLDTVPGIDDSIKQLLMRVGIFTTYQLVGQFLIFCGRDSDPTQISERFSSWLGKLGVTTNMNLITASISEKVGGWIPEVYDQDFIIL